MHSRKLNAENCSKIAILFKTKGSTKVFSWENARNSQIVLATAPRKNKKPTVKCRKFLRIQCS
jgi:hypothetical protein